MYVYVYTRARDARGDDNKGGDSSSNPSHFPSRRRPVPQSLPTDKHRRAPLSRTAFAADISGTDRGPNAYTRVYRFRSSAARARHFPRARSRDEIATVIALHTKRPSRQVSSPEGRAIGEEKK